MQVTKATEMGQKSKQEDFLLDVEINIPFVSQGSGRLLAVMDGHLGSKTAETVCGTLRETFEKKIRSLEGEGFEKVLEQTIDDLSRKTINLLSGTTLSMVFLPKDESCAHIGVLGDSPVVVLDADGQVRKSPLHLAGYHFDDRVAAIKKGADYSNTSRFISFNGYALKLTRTLGDSPLSSVINRNPDVYTVDLNEKSIVLLGSDGLLGQVPIEKEFYSRWAERMIEWASQGDDADRLVSTALDDLKSRDNTSAILVKLDFWN